MKIALTIVSSIAALFLATGAAHAVEIPKQYHGQWCATEWNTIYKRCPVGELIIDQTAWSSDDSDCHVHSVRKSKYGGHVLSGVCTEDSAVRKGTPTEERWVLGSNNTRLQIIGRNLKDK
jgi:hypothetical protein